jgi:isopentenyl-diphosphate delta-isomerase
VADPGELLDLLDTGGRLTGVSKPKRQVHRDGDWHRAAHVWIAGSDGRVLLQRRALVKESWPGLWDISVAGHVSAGEEPIQAGIREAAEELGLQLEPAEMKHIGRLRYQCSYREDFIENEFHDVYLVRRDVDITALQLDPSEVAEVLWVRPEDLDQYERVPHGEEYALLLEALARE